MPPSGAKGRRSQQWALALRWDALGGEVWAGGVCFGVAAEGRGRFCATKISHPAFIQKAPFLFLPLNRRLFHLFGWAWTAEVDGAVMGAEEVMEVDVGKEHFSLGLFYLFIYYRIKYPRY